MSALAFDFVATRSPAAKPPPWFADVLVRARESLGFTGGKGRADFARRADLDYNLVMRNETPGPDQTVKGSNRIVDALRDLGADVPYAPSRPDALPPEENAAPAAESPRARRVRQNLRRLREEAGYDLEGLSDKVNLSVETLLAYERGTARPLYDDLVAIAEALGHDAQHFDMENPPPTSLPPFDDLWRRRRSHDRLTPQQRARLQDLEAKHRRDLEAAFSEDFAAAKRSQPKPRGKPRK